ncbi:unnamed protein product [Caenorhabditis angaria]|uniref:Interferon-related developmental regulator N-terminal domain-containing protein n=1 Tax=Caenorhabditis angaria TaxID=860376 RepID=A0A9P1N201_9PELO|nr:unnamed protein product [Caenorhabditis angaria]
MGKKGNKNKEKDEYNGPTRSGRRGSDSDESELSIDGDLNSVRGDVEDIDDVMDKLIENLDNAQHKNLSIRTHALANLNFALTSQYIPEFVDKNKMTLLALCSKLGNKTTAESKLLVHLLTLVSLQTGEEINDLIEEPMAQMRAILMDSSKDVGLRHFCALALGIVSRMSCSEDDIISGNLKACQFTWSSFKQSSSNSDLFTSSINSWCLLLLDADHQSISQAIIDQPKIVQFLSAEQLEIRISAGEALAFLFEFFGNIRPDYKFPNHDNVLDILDDLVSDTTKKKTKKEKRIQRYTFREIFAFMNDESDPPQVKIKFGKEHLAIQTCSMKMFYDLCCEVLHGGIMKHLQTNEVIREVLQLGDVLDNDERIEGSKAERMAIHEAADKYRKQARGKQRDKRSVVF